MEYWYKQKCDDCPTCKSCNSKGYTESNTWDKEDIPDNAYDIVEEQECDNCISNDRRDFCDHI